MLMAKSENFLKNFSKNPKWLQEKRTAALELFEKLQMPDFIYGLNINLDINLDLRDIQPEKSGIADREIISNDKDMIIEDFDGAIKSNENLLKENLMSKCVLANDKFTSFHQAFFNNLLFVYVPK